MEQDTRHAVVRTGQGLRREGPSDSGPVTLELDLAPGGMRALDSEGREQKRPSLRRPGLRVSVCLCVVRASLCLCAWCIHVCAHVYVALLRN